MRLLAAYTLFGFSGFFVTMSALPAWIASGGTDASLAGLVTTTLLVATVATQTMVPRLVQRSGMTITLGLGMIFLGAPSLLLLIDGGYWWILVICALRGFGFGILTVIGSLLTARIVPPRRRGEAVGIYGLSIAVPNLIAVAGGVALVSAGHFTVVALIGAAPLLGLVVVPGLARAADAVEVASAADVIEAAGATEPSSGALKPAGATDPAPPAMEPSREAARATRRAARLAALGPSLVLLVVTLVSGGFMTYLPIERPDGSLATIALLVWGVMGALFRWRVGLVADRVGLKQLLPAASMLGVVGILIVAGGLIWGGALTTAVVLVGAAVLGAGYGATQNLTLVAAFASARQQEPATVSAIWNVGFDAGTAIGSALVGALIVGMSIPAALALTSLLIVASMPWAIRGGRPPG